MRPLRYSINMTLDGCTHHEAGIPSDEESMQYWTSQTAQVDALILGRVTHQMMESAWRRPTTGTWPDGMQDWEVPFAEAMDRARKYVVSGTLTDVDWNAELLRGEVGPAVRPKLVSRFLPSGSAKISPPCPGRSSTSRSRGAGRSTRR